MEEILKGKRILIVDDEPDILETLKDLLDMCIIDTAPNFETARKFLKKTSYDAAILDIMGVKGYDILELTKEKGIPALMLTAHALSADNLVRSIKGGALRAASPEQRFESRLKLGKGKRLNDIIIPTRAQPRNPIIHFPQRAQDQRRGLVSGGTQGPNNRKAVQSGQHAVDHQHVVALARSHHEAFLSIRCVVDDGSDLLQSFNQVRSDERIVFYDEHSHRLNVEVCRRRLRIPLARLRVRGEAIGHGMTMVFILRGGATRHDRLVCPSGS